MSPGATEVGNDRNLGCSVTFVVARVNLACGVGVNTIIERVVSSYGHEVSLPAKERLSKYIRLLSSAGIADEQQLLTFGMAYLKESLQPDPRYTGR